jgi:hypothetical protein
MSGTVTNTKDTRHGFRLRPVSRYFRRDWHFAIRVAYAPLLRQAALVIALMPILEKILPMQHFAYLWILWSASVAFIFGFAVLQMRAPAFVQEYQNYAQFEARKHSHRWIVWEFWRARTVLPEWAGLLRELCYKQLAYPVAMQLDCDAYRVCPTFTPTTNHQTDALEPVNANRDIYLPIVIDGDRFVLPMQESDPDLGNKQKELFWILFTEGAKATPISRGIVWAAFALAAALAGIYVLNNILRAFGTSVL